MALLDHLKESLLGQIAKMTSPDNSALREIVETANPEDVDADTLAKIARNLRESEVVTSSITGDAKKE